jgi:hypothetical protein
MTIMLSFPDVKGRLREAIASELVAEGIPAPQPVEKDRPDPVRLRYCGSGHLVPFGPKVFSGHRWLINSR